MQFLSGFIPGSRWTILLSMKILIRYQEFLIGFLSSLYNGWAIKECHLLYFDDIAFVFHPDELILFSKYAGFESLQNTTFLLSKIIFIILKYVIQLISLKCTTFKDNLLTNLSNCSMTRIFFDAILSQLTA